MIDKKPDASRRREWRKIEAAMRGEEVSEGRTMTNQRDWWAIIGVIASLLVQAAIIVWWGSKLTSVQTDHEKRISGMEDRERQETLRNSVRDASIAVIGSQVDDIRKSVGRIESKLDTRK
jgi:hypothetical protein